MPRTRRIYLVISVTSLLLAIFVYFLASYAMDHRLACHGFCDGWVATVNDGWLLIPAQLGPVLLVTVSFITFILSFLSNKSGEK